MLKKLNIIYFIFIFILISISISNLSSSFAKECAKPTSSKTYQVEATVEKIYHHRAFKQTEKFYVYLKLPNNTVIMENNRELLEKCKDKEGKKITIDISEVKFDDGNTRFFFEKLIQ